jgi:hypothetical protein
MHKNELRFWEECNVILYNYERKQDTKHLLLPSFITITVYLVNQDNCPCVTFTLNVKKVTLSKQ